MGVSLTHVSELRGSGRPWPRAGEAKSNEMVRELWTGLDDGGWFPMTKIKIIKTATLRLTRFWNVGNWSGELNLVFLWIVWAIIQKLSPNLLTVAPRLWLTHTVTPCHPLYCTSHSVNFCARFHKFHKSRNLHLWSALSISYKGRREIGHIVSLILCRKFQRNVPYFLG